MRVTACSPTRSPVCSPGPRPARRMRAAHLLSGAVVQVVAGQCLDLSLEGRAGAAQATYLRLVTMKTGALLGAAMAAGAVLAGAPRAVARRFDAAGRLLGLAFQVRDDWLGTWGDPQLTGKGRSGDLRRRKLTYPVVAAYEVATPVRRRELRRLFREREPGGEFRLRALLDELGGPALTTGVPMVLARDAIAALTGFPTSRSPVSRIWRSMSLNATAGSSIDTNTGSRTASRKDEHLRINIDEDVAAKGVETGFDDWRFVHRALPEIDLDDVALRANLLGRPVGAPLLVSCMTGGTEQTPVINGGSRESHRPMGSRWVSVRAACFSNNPMCCRRSTCARSRRTCLCSPTSARCN